MKKNIHIITDTREKRPWEFDPVASRKKLPSGDYSIRGLENLITVERKSLNDFVHSLTKERNRFFQEIVQLSKMHEACIVVEGSLRDVADGNYKSRVNSNSLLGSIASISVKFGVPIYFCFDRPVARLFAWHWLNQCQQQLLSHIKKGIQDEKQNK